LSPSFLVAGSALAGIALVIGVSVAVWEPSASNEEIQASCPEPRDTVVPDEWRQQYAEEGTAFHDAVLSAEAQKAILQPSRVTPAPSFVSASSERQIEALRAGKILVRSSRPEQNLGAVDWGTTSEGRFYSTQLHGFAGIGSALSSPSKLPAEIERKIAVFIKDWAVCNIPEPGLNERAWFEGTVVKRLSNLLVALNYMKRHGSIAGLGYDQLIFLIAENKDALVASDDVYSFGNHGIRQDMILAATAIALPELPDSDHLIRLAEKRLGEASKELFTREGIWAEHAPGYVNYALHLMFEIKDLAEVSPRFNPHAFLSRIPTSVNYLLTSLTPSLQMPWVGDSGGGGVAAQVREYAERTYGESLRAHIDGLSGTAVLYPDYGHALVREDGFYLLFHAAQNLPAGKRHEDALSFILFNEGRLWITEGGFQDYEQTEMMQYLRSPYAHNTYVYGDDYIPSDERPDLEAYMRGMTVSGDKVLFEAVSERYPHGAVVTRRITVDRTTHALAINDLLSAPAPEDTCFHGSLNFAPDLDVRVQPAAGTIVASDPGSGTALTVELVSEDMAGFHRFSGQKDPLRGWGRVVKGFGPVQTVVYDVCGSGPVEISLNWSGGD
jgi:Heparinase II/III-like protein/Heparinase II/III N-terminus